MTILITGSSGFIGSTLVRSPWVQNHEAIIGFDLKPADPVGLPENFVEVIGDLNDADFLQYFIDLHKPEAVVHLAALSDILASRESGAAFIGANVMMTNNVLNAVTSIPNVHFTIAGSAAEYGDIPFGDPAPSEKASLRPDSPYGVSKVATSMATYGQMTRYGVPASILRFGNVYGPRQREKIVPAIIRNAFNSGVTMLGGFGKPTRSYVYVDDVCEAIGRAVHMRAFGIFNITNEAEISNLDLAILTIGLIESVYPSIRKCEVDRLLKLEDTHGGAQRVTMDATLAKKRLGWGAKIPLVDGLKYTIEHFMKEIGLEVRAA